MITTVSVRMITGTVFAGSTYDRKAAFLVSGPVRISFVVFVLNNFGRSSAHVESLASLAIVTFLMRQPIYWGYGKVHRMNSTISW